MKGKSTLIWLAMAGAAGAVLFQTSYTVQNREEQLATLNRKIVAEQEAIQILKAEWSYLNDPSRLETLARTHLALRPTDARQFVASAAVIPLRATPPVPAPDAAAQMAGLPTLQTQQQATIVRASAPGVMATALPATVAATGTAAAAAGVASARTAAVGAPPAKAPAAGAPLPAAIEPAGTRLAPPKVLPAAVKAPAQPLSQTPKTPTPAGAKPPPAAPKTDSLGVMIARLGGAR